MALLDPNIPGLKQAMFALRWLTRWPAMLVLTTGRFLYNIAIHGGDVGASQIAPELKAYKDAHAKLFKVLGDCIEKEKSAIYHHPFWDALDTEWKNQIESLTIQFGEKIGSHMKETDEQIKSAAKDIFQELEKSPGTLLALRSARVAATTGGILVGIAFAGTGSLIYDFLQEAFFIPLLMSTTEAATAAMTNTYVTMRRNKLVEKLKDDARVIAKDLYERPLIAVAKAAMHQSGLLEVEEELVVRLQSNIAQLQSEI